jgi:hypothetical protein
MSLQLIDKIERVARAVAPGGSSLTLRNSNLNGVVRFDSAGQLQQMDLNANGVHYLFECWEQGATYACRKTLADGTVFQEDVTISREWTATHGWGSQPGTP